MRSLSLIVCAVVFGCSEPDAAIDDPCDSSDDCAVSNAECVDLGDGILRCEKACVFDLECGDGATCAFVNVTDTVGVCYRLCITESDCAIGNWSCVPFADDPYTSYCE